MIVRYLERSRDLGKTLGFTGFDVVELPESRATRALDRKQEEGRLLLSRLEGMTFIALDETGQSPTSDAFAQWHSNFRDNGTRNLVFVLGGADGLDSTVIKAAHTKLAFGAMTLPHQLARIVLCEQLYRAMTLLAGHPYHRA